METNKSTRLLLVVLLVFSVLSATGATAWASSASANQYLKLHPNLTLYLDHNPGVAKQVLSPGESADDLVSRLVQVINGFGGGYLAKHPRLALYLAHNPGVARQVLDYQGQPATGPASGQPGSGSGPTRFTDVPSWAQQAVGAMAARGIINGMGKGIFGSNQTLTRAQFAALLVREFGLLSTSGSVYGTVNFADVPTTFWAYNDIEAAAPDMTYWMVGGQNYFHPKDPADREDCMVAMVEAAGLANQSVDASSVLSKFVDAGRISPNLVNQVAIAVQSGMITGSQGADGNWYLAPQATLTRAEGAVLLYRALSYSKVAPGGA